MLHGWLGPEQALTQMPLVQLPEQHAELALHAAPAAEQVGAQAPLALQL